MRDHVLDDTTISAFCDALSLPCQMIYLSPIVPCACKERYFATLLNWPPMREGATMTVRTLLPPSLELVAGAAVDRVRPDRVNVAAAVPPNTHACVVCEARVRPAASHVCRRGGRGRSV